MPSYSNIISLLTGLIQSRTLQNRQRQVDAAWKAKNPPKTLVVLGDKAKAKKAQKKAEKAVERAEFEHKADSAFAERIGNEAPPAPDLAAIYKQTLAGMDTGSNVMKMFNRLPTPQAPAPTGTPGGVQQFVPLQSLLSRERAPDNPISPTPTTPRIAPKLPEDGSSQIALSANRGPTSIDRLIEMLRSTMQGGRA